MSLRRQLMLISLVLLSLPWAGCQLTREMENALQQGQAQALGASARAVATILNDQPELIYSHLQRLNTPTQADLQVYATPSDAPVIVDGYDDEWDPQPQVRYGPILSRARLRKEKLYLQVTIDDEQVRYYEPVQGDRLLGDYVQLRLGDGRTIYITSAAPGAFSALERRGETWARAAGIHGVWQDHVTGYSLEIELPLALAQGRLGLCAIDSSSTRSNLEPCGNFSPDTNALPPWLIYPGPRLNQLIAPFADSGLQLTIVDRDRWLMSSSGALADDPQLQQRRPDLLRLILRRILESGDTLPQRPVADRWGRSTGVELDHALSGRPSQGRYRSDNQRSSIVIAAAPIRSAGRITGAVVAAQASDRYLSLSDKTLQQLIIVSLAVMIACALVLVGYASLLSWRIRALSVAAAGMIRNDGTLDQSFHSSTAGDEIGELSRTYENLLDRLHDYTDYLRTLSSKLSHELRTPIALVRSSLEHLQDHPEESEIYLVRAREGLNRLAGILTQMSEASQLEDSLAGAELKPLNLGALVTELFNAYQQLHPEFDWRLSRDATPCMIAGSADHLSQLLDKLVDNAVSFCPTEGRITLGIQQSGKTISLTLANQGPPLPESMRSRLFDSMVSMRTASSDDSHLGLGLHIVHLIADHHGANVSAANLKDGRGVIFSVNFSAA